jgi:type II secretory pathway component HofQ
MRSISRRLLAIAILLIVVTGTNYAQGRYGTARGLVASVQRNLRHAERFTRPSGKEKERYYNAQRHLSQFDRKLSQGKFDKDKLDEAIDDVKNVVENNTLSPESRDVLTRDLAELREMRRTRGAAY